MLAVAGIHGNEPAGILAVRRILGRIEAERSRLVGEFVALAGNLRALERDSRFVDEDLNRRWHPRQVGKLRGEVPATLGAIEDREQSELLEEIDACLERSTGESFFLDLHTSSAPGCPFVTVGDTLRNRAFASSFPLPLILGLEEQVDGALLEYLNNLGLVTMGVEGGGHEASSSVDHLEAAVWIALAAAGLLPETTGGLEESRALLRSATAGKPRVIEVRHRHGVHTGDGFRMEPGFKNFHAVRKGDLLARDDCGEIRAPMDGRVLLPLYQGQGDDGFFIARDVRPFVLEVSKLLRHLRVGNLVRHLPGVRPHHEWHGTLVVDTRVARYFPLDLLHLLGYRKLRREGAFLVVNRRRFDLAPPSRR
jgi:succinylglutamate desuccinylase